MLWQEATDVLPFIVLIVGLVFAKNGLYRSRESRPGGSAIVASLAFSTLIVALFALVTGREFNSYATFFVVFVLAVVLVTALRASYDSATLALMRSLGMRRRTLLAGRAEALDELFEALSAPLGGPEPEMLGTVSDSPLLVSGLGNLGAMDDLPALVRELRPDDLVLAGAELPDSALLELADACRSTHTRLRFVPTTAELLLQRASFVPGQVVPLLELRPPVLTGLEWAVKRSFDLVVATIVLILSSPVLVAIAIAVRVTSPGPVIFRDQRIGVGEGKFAMLKFRSMYDGAQDMQDSLEHHNEADGAIFKMRDDPRVTPVGRLIRRLLARRDAAARERAARRDEPRRAAAAAGARLRPAERLAPQALRGAARYHGALADLGAVEPQLRRPRAARLLLPRELVRLDGRRGADAHAVRGVPREGRVLADRSTLAGGTPRLVVGQHMQDYRTAESHVMMARVLCNRRYSRRVLEHRRRSYVAATTRLPLTT